MRYTVISLKSLLSFLWINWLLFRQILEILFWLVAITAIKDIIQGLAAALYRVGFVLVGILSYLRECDGEVFIPLVIVPCHVHWAKFLRWDK